MEKKKKIIKIVLIVSIVLFLIILIIANKVAEKKKIEDEKENYYANKIYNSIEDFKTVEEVIIYKKAKYIKEEESNVEGYDVDIYTNLKYPLYTDIENNSLFYKDMIKKIAYVLQYKNFRVIDEEKNIVIAAICDASKKSIVKLYVNGEENYWENRELATNLNRINTQEASRNIVIQSEELKNLIANQWKRNKLKIEITKNKIGDYEIFEEQGLQIRTIYKKVFNIIFTSDYNKEVVNNIKTGTDLKEIIRILGTPTFGEENLGLIGYKGEKIYVFFTESKISVYRVEDQYEKLDEFIILIEKFEREKNVKEFVNGITDIWPDYDQYDWDKNYVHLQYTLKGIKIEFNISSNQGITYSSNFTGKIRENLTVQDIQNNIEKLPKYTFFDSEDSVYKLELERYFGEAEETPGE
ncbi:MAG: hypothetical protein ACI4XD_04255 [Clostridia bacterium]